MRVEFGFQSCVDLERLLEVVLSLAIEALTQPCQPPVAVGQGKSWIKRDCPVEVRDGQIQNIPVAANQGTAIIAQARSGLI